MERKKKGHMKLEREFRVRKRCFVLSSVEQRRRLRLPCVSFFFRSGDFRRSPPLKRRPLAAVFHALLRSVSDPLFIISTSLPFLPPKPLTIVTSSPVLLRLFFAGDSVPPCASVHPSPCCSPCSRLFSVSSTKGSSSSLLSISISSLKRV